LTSDSGVKFFLKVFQKYFLIFWCVILSTHSVIAQYMAPLYTNYTTPPERAKLYDRLVNNAILKSLSLPLSDSTEEDWMGAFDAMEVLNYKTAFTEAKIKYAFDSIFQRSIPFQRALLEVIFTNYPGTFIKQAAHLLQETADPKIFAMAAEYMMQNQSNNFYAGKISGILRTKFGDSTHINPILIMLSNRLQHSAPDDRFSNNLILKRIFNKDFLPGQVLLISIQRKDRDYPGLALVRNKNGDFVKDSMGRIFAVPQLARSITNLPCYLTNGNTPQGIFRMYGFDVSMSSFIGPTPNIQLGMPVELNVRQFFDDSTTTDTVWTLTRYLKLLPGTIRSYQSLSDAYYAGLAGRTEIIAHGTTIDPQYYTGQPYYPLTPTEGCLCAKEIWDGYRKESDQQKLVDALIRAGGANGYCIVIDINDKHSPVSLAELLPLLKK
jgi:hypothetical protein